MQLKNGVENMAYKPNPLVIGQKNMLLRGGSKSRRQYKILAMIVTRFEVQTPWTRSPRLYQDENKSIRTTLRGWRMAKWIREAGTTESFKNFYSMWVRIPSWPPFL